ncbi:pleckstrin homology domain-containing family G member 7-like isoform X1 [Argopecten irradians]|uniref:pleckstrin homology domain-containing family G member 7-like isoform X1 n=2 Tax=Argopecten irradians TaxID=31199 RepID=UPI0037107300
MSQRKSTRTKKDAHLLKGFTIDDSALNKLPKRSQCRSRRNSSMSLTSPSSESEGEPSPLMPRRGRRLAIVDTSKNCGESVSMSSDATPSNSCDECDTDKAARFRSRRRSSIDLETKTYQRDQILRDKRKRLIKRNTIADFYRSRESPSSDDNKKGRPTTFSFRRLIKTRSKEELSKLGDVLTKLAPSQFQDSDLAAYKNCHWSDLIVSSDKERQPIKIAESERKRREAVWELFTSECVFLIDHLMALKHCFLEPLKKVQVEGFLMYIEPPEIFCNLDDLCYVSYTFCKDLISVLTKNMSNTEIWETKRLEEVLERFATLSEEGEVYHTYCLNYTKGLSYLEKLKKNDDYCEFEKWCEQDPRCNRLQLNDLLVSPMQHCTKLPLLLANIRKYTLIEADRGLLAAAIGKLEVSLQNLEEKMRKERNTQRLQEIQQQLVWPSISDLDPKVYIPDFLKSSLSIQPCTKLLSCPKRQLMHEGLLTLVEATKSIDVHLFLFDDILLITKIKKSVKKKQNTFETFNTNDCNLYTVHRQPIALDRLSVHDVGIAEASANGLKHCIVLVHISRFQQIIGVFTLQSTSEYAKDYWMTKLCDAKKKYHSSPHECGANGLVDYRQQMPQTNIATTPTNHTPGDISPRRLRRARMLSAHKKKSVSMDTVFIT